MTLIIFHLLSLLSNQDMPQTVIKHGCKHPGTAQFHTVCHKFGFISPVFVDANPLLRSADMILLENTCYSSEDFPGSIQGILKLVHGRLVGE